VDVGADLNAEVDLQSDDFVRLIASYRCVYRAHARTFVPDPAAVPVPPGQDPVWQCPEDQPDDPGGDRVGCWYEESAEISVINTEALATAIEVRVQLADSFAARVEGELDSLTVDDQTRYQWTAATNLLMITRLSRRPIFAVGTPYLFRRLTRRMRLTDQAEAQAVAFELGGVTPFELSMGPEAYDACGPAPNDDLDPQEDEGRRQDDGADGPEAGQCPDGVIPVCVTWGSILPLHDDTRRALEERWSGRYMPPGERALLCNDSTTAFADGWAASFTRPFDDKNIFEVSINRVQSLAGQ